MNTELCCECQQVAGTMRYGLCHGCYFNPEIHRRHRLAAANVDDPVELTGCIDDTDDTSCQEADDDMDDASCQEANDAMDDASCQEADDAIDYQYGFGADSKHIAAADAHPPPKRFSSMVPKLLGVDIGAPDGDRTVVFIVE